MSDNIGCNHGFNRGAGCCPSTAGCRMSTSMINDRCTAPGSALMSCYPPNNWLGLKPSNCDRTGNEMDEHLPTYQRANEVFTHPPVNHGMNTFLLRNLSTSMIGKRVSHDDVDTRTPKQTTYRSKAKNRPLKSSGFFTRSSSREVRIRVPGTLFSVVYFSRGTLPKKRVKGHYWGT